MAIKKDEKISIRVPKKTRKRYRWDNDRTLRIDLRCIRTPSKNNKQLPVRMKFQSPEHLQLLCDEYFASCEGVIYNNKTGRPYEDKDGYPLMGQIKPYTISGLALYLDVSTSVLRGYEKGRRDELGIPEDDEYMDLQYSDVIRRARQKIEAYAEQRLYDKEGFNGSKFVLDCAFKWQSHRDQEDIENMRELRKLRREEFELKKESHGDNITDDNFSITIVRKKKEDD